MEPKNNESSFFETKEKKYYLSIFEINMMQKMFYNLIREGHYKL
jgi:hypothetical protein